MCKESFSIRTPHLTLYLFVPTKLQAGESSAPHNLRERLLVSGETPKAASSPCVCDASHENYFHLQLPWGHLLHFWLFVQTTSLSAAEKQGDVLESALEWLPSTCMCLMPESSRAWVSCGILSVVSPRAQLPSPADLMTLSTLLASPGTAAWTWNKYSKLHFPRLVCREGLKRAINTQRSLN